MPQLSLPSPSSSVLVLCCDWCLCLCRYYVTSSGEQAGPVNADELRVLHHQKQTHDGCLCWNEHMDGWTLIGDVPVLQKHIAAAGKTLPPPLPSMQAPSPQITVAAEVAPAPASLSSPSSASSSSLQPEQSPRAALSVKGAPSVGAVAAAAASKYRRMKKDRASMGSIGKAQAMADSPSGGNSKKFGTMKPAKPAASSQSSSPAQAASPRDRLSSASASSSSSSSTTAATASSSSSPPAPAAAASAHSSSLSAVSTPAYVPPAAPSGGYTAEEISEQLTSAIAALDPEAITYWLAAGDAIQLDELRFCSSPLARMYLSKLDTARRRMRDAVKSMDETELCEAVWYSEAIGYQRLDVVSCRKLRDAVIQLNLEARQQLLLLDDRKMKAVLARAEQLSLNSPAVEQLRTIAQHTSEEKLRQLQLKAANAVGDRHRATRLTIALKDLVFKRSGHLFTLDSYGRWRDADEWAAEKVLSLSKADVKDGMRRWSREVIHASLTRLSKEQQKPAIKAFKRILAYCGERSGEQGGQYEQVRELLDIGLRETALRDEIYLQLIKQLTLNPHSDSEKAAWRLMYACLETFPPNAEMENILELWLSKHLIQGTEAVRFLRQTLYDGERRCVPTEAELSVICSGKSLRHCQYEEEREYHTPRALLPDKAEVQRLAGTTAAGIKQFIASGAVPDWTEIEIRMPDKEIFKQPEPKCEPKEKGEKGKAAPVQPAASTAVAAAAAAKEKERERPVNGFALPPPQPRLMVDTHSTAAAAAAVHSVSPLSPSDALQSLPSAQSPSPVARTSLSSRVSNETSTPSPIPPPLLSASLPSPLSPSSSATRAVSGEEPLSSSPPPPPPAPAAAPERLRVWGKAADPSTGQAYYYHLQTHETTWDQPVDYFE